MNRPTPLAKAYTLTDSFAPVFTYNTLYTHICVFNPTDSDVEISIDGATSTRLVIPAQSCIALDDFHSEKQISARYKAGGSAGVIYVNIW